MKEKQHGGGALRLRSPGSFHELTRLMDEPLLLNALAASKGVPFEADASASRRMLIFFERSQNALTTNRKWAISRKKENK